jgi:membrane protease YdiL (CAAX protease family)
MRQSKAKSVMQTAIGQRLNSSRSRLALASVVGISVVTADFALIGWGHYPEKLEGSGVLAILALAAQLRLTDGDLASVGLHLTPSQGWRWWVKVSLWIGILVGASTMVVFGLWVLSGRDLPIYATPPSHMGRAFLRMCVFAPVLEEVVYRLALCVPLAVWPGPWGAIVVSGLVFATLHVARSNPMGLRSSSDRLQARPRDRLDTAQRGGSWLSLPSLRLGARRRDGSGYAARGNRSR